MIGSAIERNAVCEQPPIDSRKIGSLGIENRMMEEASSASRWRTAILALPGIEADVVMVAACAQEGCGVAETLIECEAKDIAIEGNRTFEICHLQVNVADSSAWRSRIRSHGRREAYSIS